MVIWACLGIGLALWAACFVWHDLRARRACGRPGALFGALARWSALAVAVPVTLVALYAAVWLGAGGVLGADTFVGFVLVLVVLFAPFVALGGIAFYLREKRTRARTNTSAASATTEVGGASPVRDTRPNREASLLDDLLSLCHNDRALCERLIERERGLHSPLSREELLELAIQNFRADNR